MATFTDWWHNTVSAVMNAESLSSLLRDRATYEPLMSQYVNYSVASPKDAPASLTFGPSFMELAGTYAGSVVLGEKIIHNTKLC